jgi:hypothetical protein
MCCQLSKIMIIDDLLLFYRELNELKDSIEEIKKRIEKDSLDHISKTTDMFTKIMDMKEDIDRMRHMMISVNKHS